MNLTSIKILLPEIMTDLSVGLNWLTWVVNAYTLPLAVLTPVAGRIADLYGPRRFFIVGIFILGLGSLLCGIAFSLPWLIGGRLIQALGAALLVPSSLTILLSRSTVETRGRLLGIWGGIGAMGAVIGPVFSGYLTDFFSWRGSFLAVAVPAFLIAYATWRTKFARQKTASLEDNRNTGFDALGTTLLMSAIASVLMGLTLLPDWGWQNNWIRMSFFAFMLLMYAFYRVERIARDPLLDPLLMREPRFKLGLLVAFLEQFVIAGTLFVMPIFFSTVQGHAAAATALLLIPAALSVALVSPIGGRLSDHFGPGLPITVGMLMRTISFIMLSRITSGTEYLYIAGGLALNGFGFALTSTPALHAVLSTVDPRQHGIVSGVHNMMRFTGAAAGTTASGIILYALIPASFDSIAGPIPGFHEAFMLGAAVCLPGIAAGIYLARQRLINA